MVVSQLALVSFAAFFGVTRSWTFGSTCDAGKQDVIKKEIGYALEMAQYASQHGDTGPYLDAMFEGQNFGPTVKQVFGNIAKMLDPNDKSYEFVISCDNTTPYCTDQGWYAHMNDKNKAMNFCDKYFANLPDKTEKAILSTDQRLGEGGDADFDLKRAQWSRSAVIIHECTHTQFATGATRTKDFAYGYTDCWKLTRGQLDRSCVKYLQKPKTGKPPPAILCPDPKDPTKEGVCDAAIAQKNADSFSFVAAGVWYSSKIGKEVPLPPNPVPLLSLLIPIPLFGILPDPFCDSDDWIVIDGELDDEDGTAPPPASITTPPAPVPTVYCTNPSLEDGNGLCTCNIGTHTFTTFTPDGGPGNSCRVSTVVVPSGLQRRAVYTTMA